MCKLRLRFGNCFKGGLPAQFPNWCPITYISSSLDYFGPKVCREVCRDPHTAGFGDNHPPRALGTTILRRGIWCSALWFDLLFDYEIFKEVSKRGLAVQAEESDLSTKLSLDYTKCSFKGELGVALPRVSEHQVQEVLAILEMAGISIAIITCRVLDQVPGYAIKGGPIFWHLDF